ncbi:MAG: sulfatase family protein, partial [Armatimonadota bacterium]
MNDTKKRPNLLFVLSDQQSYDMLGCYGNTQIITPNIDKLASEGVRFNHCVSNSPICTPYRGILFSGQHPLYNGAYSNDIQMLQGNGNYFGEVLRDAGYKMGYFGKWHLYGGERNRPVPEGPYRNGFDGDFLTDNCTEEFRPGHCYYWNAAGEKIIFNEWEPYGQTRQALEFLDNCTQDEPFALFVSWHPPHNMGGRDGRFYYDTEPELMDLYAREKIELRENVEDTPEVREAYHGHMAMCSGVDTALGWLTQKLKDMNLDDNTIVVYSSDHGDMLYSCGRPWPKGFPEDESLRVPLIIRWPGKLAPSVSDLIVSTFDLMPTVLSMMDLRIPETCQGIDLALSIFNHNDDAVESAPLMIISMGQGWRGIYTRRYTYSFDERIESPVRFNCLYDKEADPRQQNNLFDSPEHREIQDELHRETLKWMARFDDEFVSGATVFKVCFGDAGQPMGLPG